MRGIGQLIAVMIVAGLVFAYIWWIVAAICCIVAVKALIAGAQQAKTARLEKLTQARAIAARADEQHTLALAGDPAGMYGMYPPEAAA